MFEKCFIKRNRMSFDQNKRVCRRFKDLKLLKRFQIETSDCVKRKTSACQIARMYALTDMSSLDNVAIKRAHIVTEYKTFSVSIISYHYGII